MKFTTGETMDKWQEQAIRHKGNMALRCGRQTGKSEVVSEKAKRFAMENPNTTTLVIAASQRQSSLIFEKVRNKITIENEKIIETTINEELQKLKANNGRLSEKRKKDLIKECSLFAEPPTQTKVLLKNGSKIVCVPTGRTGDFIRGYSIDLLIADEGAYIPQPVWLVVMPMIAVSKKTRGFGWIVILSTPAGKGGFFYDCTHDKDFLQFHVSSEDCPRISKSFLAKERRRLSKAQYAQEYLAEFVEEFSQIFPTDLLKERMTFLSWNYENHYNRNLSYYLGVDFARFGKDENAFCINEINTKTGLMKTVRVFTTERKSIVDSVNRIIKLNELYNFRKIFVDDGGVGGGATDLLIDKLGKNKIRALNNSSKSTTKIVGKILKEDMYSNALVLLENSKLDLIHDMDLLKSLRSMTFEYNESGKLRIHGSYSHIAESFVRACWAIKEKGLKLFLT